MVPRNQRQEALSRAYVRAIAAQAGVICSDLSLDFGIDMCLRAVDESGHQFCDTGDQLDVQVKSTTRANLTDLTVVYDLEVRAYELLRRDKPRCPRILVLLVLPENERQWLSQSADELLLRRCAYWMSLRGAAATVATSTVRIAIPRANVFSVEAVQKLMGTLTQGGMP